MPVTDQRARGARPRRPRNRFAFFGQLNQYKGADVLLDAMRILGEDFDGHLWIHGANFDIQPIEFRESVKAAPQRRQGERHLCRPLQARATSPS